MAVTWAVTLGALYCTTIAPPYNGPERPDSASRDMTRCTPTGDPAAATLWRAGLVTLLSTSGFPPASSPVDEMLDDGG